MGKDVVVAVVVLEAEVEGYGEQAGAVAAGVQAAAALVATVAIVIIVVGTAEVGATKAISSESKAVALEVVERRSVNAVPLAHTNTSTNTLANTATRTTSRRVQVWLRPRFKAPVHGWVEEPPPMLRLVPGRDRNLMGSREVAPV